MRLVTVGGVAAGMSAAAKARRLNPDLDIRVYEKSPHISYGACGMPYVIGGEIDGFERLIARTPEQFAKQKIQVFTRHEVLEVDHGRRQVLVLDLASGRQSYQRYDKLLLATGASAIMPPIEGKSLPGIHTLRTLTDGMALERAVAAGARHALIVGGGYIGLEMAEAFHARGLKVTVAEMQSRLLGTVDPEISAPVKQTLASRGVDLQLNTRVLAVEGSDAVERVVTDRGVVDDVDLVLVSAGVRPNSGLAKSIGARLTDFGAISVSERMETSIPDVYAAGDVVAVTHLVSGEETYIPLGDTANKQGRVAGVNLAGGDATFAGVMGTAVSRVFDLAVARTGLSGVDAERLGMEVESVQVKSFDHAHFYPDHRPLSMRLTYLPGSRCLVGAQIIGHGDAVKRIDTIAALLHFGAKVDDLRRLDLAYAPPFSPVWDPMLVAANVA